MTKVEQVARAMATARWKINGSEKFDPNDAYDLTNNNGRFEFDEMARAAILAMREPTDEMIDAGVEAKTKLYEKFEAQGINTRTLLVANHPAGTIYEAMIDAALSETSEES